MKRTSWSSETLLVISMIIIAVPVIWLVITSFNAPREIISRGFEFSMSNYVRLFEGDSAIGAQIGNSLIIAVSTTVFTMAIAALAGYSLSSLGWSRTTTGILLGISALIQLIPPMTLVPGLYVVLQQFGILNSLPGLIILNVLFNLPFATLMLKVYFDALPDSIREAGLVDGASEQRVFWSLVLPLVKPGLAAVGIYVLIMAWNEFLMGLTMTTGGDQAPITVGIASLVQPQAITYGPMAALGSLTVVPIIILAIIANKQIVAGLTGGAVKG
ncbi:carbohydrate ABC transporter permease [Tessaracoccus antarcticus]|uniref:Carbohydrate ABC transporter permease n=1 Tax=Tessaracoccus antarcticus TaxID=2479848 RepID=A0A3M0FX28_9ACTN|nr:carbohydrate ABC transporter permease [Tessaracoccus antarcticus]RMB57224.1 carbohydrate ABC transporter permease [Tessaracoccus antarcticus]